LQDFFGPRGKKLTTVAVAWVLGQPGINVGHRRRQQTGAARRQPGRDGAVAWMTGEGRLQRGLVNLPRASA